MPPCGRGNYHKVVTPYFVYFNFIYMVQLYKRRLDNHANVGPCSPEQYFQLSSANNTQTIEKSYEICTCEVVPHPWFECFGSAVRLLIRITFKDHCYCLSLHLWSFFHFPVCALTNYRVCRRGKKTLLCSEI